MKISDPLGKVYTHTMFKKKKTYDVRGQESDEEAVSEVSEQSDDSLSTKSSEITPSRRGSSRRRGKGEASGGGEAADAGEEQDREDAISYASRREGGRRSRKDRFGLENLGPPGTSYSLWTAQRSLKRDHRSILLVILGIMGIVGIAVYLGVVQKIEDSGKDLVSIDGAFTVVSEDFSLSLLNPNSVKYKDYTRRYEDIIKNTYKKSVLRDALIKVLIDGFSSGGGVDVYFKVIMDKVQLPGRTAEDPVMAAKDVLVGEVMALEDSEFDGNVIDLDSISFSLSAIQDIAKKYLEPEPLQGLEGTGPPAGSIWQSLAHTTAKQVAGVASTTPTYPPSSWQKEGLGMSSTPSTARIDTGLEDELGWDQDSGWDKPQYPTLQSQDLYGNNLIYNPNPNYANIGSTPRSGGGYSAGSTLAPPGSNRRPYPDNKAESWFDSNPLGSNLYGGPNVDSNPMGSNLYGGPNVDMNTLNDMYAGSNLNYGNANQDNIWNGGDGWRPEGVGAGPKPVTPMSEYMSPPPPPRRQPPQDDIIYADNSVNNDLAVLFNQEKLNRNKNLGQNREPLSLDNHLFNSDSFRPLTTSTSEKNYEKSPIFDDDTLMAEIILNQQQPIDRRSDAKPMQPNLPPRSTVSPAVNPSNGFWNVMQTRMKEKTNRDGNNINVADRRRINDDLLIKSYEEELERILAADTRPRIMNSSPSSIQPPPNMVNRKKPPAITLKAAPGLSKDPVIINNFGSSGMKPIMSNNRPSPTPNSRSPSPRPQGTPSTTVGPSVVDVIVPKDSDSGFFGVGSSLSFNGGGGGPVNPGPRMGTVANAASSYPSSQHNSAYINSVPSMNEDQVMLTNGMPSGEDPHIIYPQQITPGTPLRQGPQGPIVASKPRMPNLSVPQTPHAPVTPNPDNYDHQYPHHRVTQPENRRTDIARFQPNFHPSSEAPPVVTSSLSSLFKFPSFFPSSTPQPPTVGRQDLGRPSARPPVEHAAPHRRSDILGKILPAAAVGLTGMSLMSPVGVFSNLLNAYATMDSKHDLTEKLISGATSLFRGGEENIVEENTDDEAQAKDGEVTEPTPADNQESDKSTTTQSTTVSTTSTPVTTSSPTETQKDGYTPTPNVARVKDTKLTTFSYNSEDEEEYFALLQRIRAGLDDKDSITRESSDLLQDLESAAGISRNKNVPLDRNALLEDYDYDSLDKYDVVYNDYVPSRSNMYGDLRPKPPSEDIIVVSPSPEIYNDPYEQYGVNNPNWYGDGPSSTIGYGPEDFIVETVNLDKDFFYQFFTSKPMILDTDVSTSTSVEINGGLRNYYPLKRGRGEQETLSNLPEHLIGQHILPDHILKRTGELSEDANEINTEDSLKPEILNKSKFKRYNVPPEIIITNEMNLPQYRSLDSVPQQQNYYNEEERESRNIEDDKNNDNENQSETL